MPSTNPQNRADAANKTTANAALCEDCAAAFLTIPEAADHLRVSVRFIERLIAAEALPVHRFGRLVRIKASTLHAVADKAAGDEPLPGREG